MYRLQMASFWGEVAFQSVLACLFLVNFFDWKMHANEDGAEHTFDKMSILCLCFLLFFPGAILDAFAVWNSDENSTKRRNLLRNFWHLLLVELTAVLADIVVLHNLPYTTFAFIQLFLTCLKIGCSILYTWIYLCLQDLRVVSL